MEPSGDASIGGDFRKIGHASNSSRKACLWMEGKVPLRWKTSCFFPPRQRIIERCVVSPATPLGSFLARRGLRERSNPSLVLRVVPPLTTALPPPSSNPSSSAARQGRLVYTRWSGGAATSRRWCSFGAMVEGNLRGHWCPCRPSRAMKIRYAVGQKIACLV